jgi:hypothetical protein
VNDCGSIPTGSIIFIVLGKLVQDSTVTKNFFW